MSSRNEISVSSNEHNNSDSVFLNDIDKKNMLTYNKFRITILNFFTLWCHRTTQVNIDRNYCGIGNVLMY